MTNPTTWQLFRQFDELHDELDDALTALADKDLPDGVERDAWHDIAAQATAGIEAWYSEAVPAKVEALDYYTRAVAGQAEHAKGEASRWAARGKTLARRQERVAESMLALVDAAGGSVDLDGGRRAKVREHKSQAVIVASDAPIESWGAHLRRLRIEADKAAVKRALAAGEVVPGASIETRTSRKVEVK